MKSLFTSFAVFFMLASAGVSQPVEEACEDDDLQGFDVSGLITLQQGEPAIKTCVWLAEMQEAAGVLCDITLNHPARRMCKDTCGLCSGAEETCEDDDLQGFDVSGLVTLEKGESVIKTCFWLAETQAAADVLCDITLDHPARRMCKETCGLCPEAEETCEDDHLQAFDVSGPISVERGDSPIKTCFWLSQMQEAAAVLCDVTLDHPARRMCKATCGLCPVPEGPEVCVQPVDETCEDDDLQAFDVSGLVTLKQGESSIKTCIWLMNTEAAAAVLCDTTLYHPAQQLCKETCGLCEPQSPTAEVCET